MQTDGLYLRRTELADRTPLLVARAGMGHAKALVASRHLTARGIAALVSAGVSGGLDPGLRTGDVIVADHVVDASGTEPRTLPDPAPAAVEEAEALLSSAGFTVHAGTILTVSGPVYSPEAKAELHGRFGALGVDMEGAGTAQGAQEAGIPLFVLRIVFDSAFQAIPPLFARLVDGQGVIRAVPAALGILGRPALIRHLPGLAGRYAVALHTLRSAWQTLEARGFPAFLTGLGPQPRP